MKGFTVLREGFATLSTVRELLVRCTAAVLAHVDRALYPQTSMMITSLIMKSLQPILTHSRLPIFLNPSSTHNLQKEPKSDKPKGIDAGFTIIPYGGTTEARQRLLFTESMPAGVKELFATLNGPDERYPAGSIMLVVDPDKQDNEQIAHMQAAKARIDAALALCLSNRPIFSISIKTPLRCSPLPPVRRAMPMDIQDRRPKLRRDILNR